jgi:hypothetical protein
MVSLLRSYSAAALASAAMVAAVAAVRAQDVPPKPAQIVITSAAGPALLEGTRGELVTRAIKMGSIARPEDSVTLAGPSAAVRLQGAPTGLQIVLPATFDPAEVMLVRLKEKDGRREVIVGPPPARKFEPGVTVALHWSEPQDAGTEKRYQVDIGETLKTGEHAIVVFDTLFAFGVN